MNPEQAFSISNSLALAGWLILIFTGRKRWSAPLVTGAILPALLAILYAILLATHFAGSDGGFGSLAEVSKLFANPWLLLAGWVHYLAFDLFIGSWQVRDAQSRQIPHLVVIPCLILTFLFGPIGLLLYLAIRLVRARSLRLD